MISHGGAHIDTSRRVEIRASPWRMLRMAGLGMLMTAMSAVVGFRVIDNVPDGAIIRSISGSWYEKMGDTLQWITEDNQLAIQLGLTDRRYGADNRYNDVFVTQFEESKRYSWEARLRDARSGAIPLNEHPVDRGFTLDQIRSAARSLGFDDVRLDKPDMSRGSFIPSAKSIRLVKNGEGYGANMDLIARIITGDNVFAYPSAWGDYRSWNAYLMPS